MNRKFTTLSKLSLIDREGFKDVDFYITGSLTSERPTDSIKTPAEVAERMLSKFSLPLNGEQWLEPCAGQGGIVEQFVARNLSDIDLTFNEINHSKKRALVDKFMDFKNVQPSPYEKGGDSLRKVCGNHIGIYKNWFDKVIMNPPFDKAHEFLQEAILRWAKPGGEISSLFPTYALSQLHSNHKTFLCLLACQKFSIEEVSGFDCSYGAKVSLIHILK